MKIQRSKLLIVGCILLGIVIAVSLTSSYWGGGVDAEGRRTIEYGRDKSLLSYLNVHGSDGLRWLKVGDETFEGVIGSSPYYHKVPNSDYIFFIQDNETGCRAHFMSLTDDSHMFFEDFSKSLSWTLSSDFNDGIKIEYYDLTNIVVTKKEDSRDRRCYFDLIGKTVYEKIIDIAPSQ